jgi:hypothetical protein
MNLSDWARDELSRGAALYMVSNVVCDALNLDIAALRRCVPGFGVWLHSTIPVIGCIGCRSYTRIDPATAKGAAGQHTYPDGACNGLELGQSARTAK